MRDHIGVVMNPVPLIDQTRPRGQYERHRKLMDKFGAVHEIETMPAAQR